MGGGRHAQRQEFRAGSALFADRVGLRQAGSRIVHLRENVTLFTSSTEYAWVNTLQIWATGTADMAQHVVHIKGSVA